MANGEINGGGISTRERLERIEGTLDKLDGKLDKLDDKLSSKVNTSEFQRLEERVLGLETLSTSGPVADKLKEFDFVKGQVATLMTAEALRGARHQDEIEKREAIIPKWVVLGTVAGWFLTVVSIIVLVILSL